MLGDAELQRVFAAEVGHADARAVGGEDGVDDEVCKAVGVVLMGEADFTEGSPGGRHGVTAVEEAVAEERGFVVVGGGAAAGHGIGELGHPAGLAQLQEAVLDAAGAGERMGGERETELEDLLHGERAMVQRQENLLVAGGEVAGM